jgi:hypothetical protein
VEPTVRTAGCGGCANDRRGDEPFPSSLPLAALMGLVVTALLIAVTGCTSMRSTMLTLTGDGWLVGQSNGSDKRFGMTRPYRGVPVKLQVPAYLHVTVGENVYLYDAETELREYQLSHPDRWVKQEIVNVDKVFTVDLVRPLSGTSSFNLAIDPKTGYFSTVSGTITDTSITDVGALVGTVASLVIPKSAGGAQEEDTPDDLRSRLVIEQRVVAERFFDLADCDLDAQVAAFIDSHVNCGHSCRGHERHGQPKGVPPVCWASGDCPAEVSLAPLIRSGTTGAANPAAAPRATANRDDGPGDPSPEMLPVPAATLTMPMSSGIAVGVDRLRSALPPATAPIDE